MLPLVPGGRIGLSTTVGTVEALGGLLRVWTGSAQVFVEVRNRREVLAALLARRPFEASMVR